MTPAKKLEAVPTATDTLREATRIRAAEHAKMEALAADVNRLRSAQHAEADALAAFNAVVAQDAAALTEWATTGAQGPAPQPDHAQRQQAAQRLADAKHAAAVEAVARETLEARYMQQHPRYAAAVTAATEAAAEVLGERLLAAQDAHREALERYHEAEQRSEALWLLFKQHAPARVLTLGLAAFDARRVKIRNEDIDRHAQAARVKAAEVWAALERGEV